MRIIAGSAKGRRLVPLKGTGIRPTSDKIRQAVFNILDREWSGTTILDLFAGTGALGIEALSRGASMAVFVDDDAYANEIIRKNLLLCGFAEQSRIFRRDPLHGLGFVKHLNLRFDVIFADPPYRLGLAQKTVGVLSQTDLLEASGIVVVECDKRESLSSPAGMCLTRGRRVYGDTMVSFFERTTATETGG